MRQNWRWWAAAALIAAMLTAVGFAVIGPAPPKSVRIAGGAAGGAYAQAAERFAAALRAEGVAASVVETAGSADNLARLQASDETAVDIAFVQSGIATLTPPAGVETLGALFVEPAWLFTTSAATRTDRPDAQALAGLRVAAGAEGSGSRALMRWLLAENGIGEESATVLAVGPREGAQLLANGGADAVFIVASPTASWVRTLVDAPGVQLKPFARAPGFERRAPHLQAVTLRRGALDMAADIPSEDTPLLAATAQLVVRADLHPAIASLLLQTAQEHYARGDVISPPGVFPNRHAVDLPVAEEAVRFYENGPSALRRYLPYWAANVVERAWMLLLPALVLASPLARSFPPIYRWRTRRKIYLWYRDLRALEARGRAADGNEARGAVRAALNDLQSEVGRIHVPESYSDELFRLREHIVFVGDMLDRGMVTKAS